MVTGIFLILVEVAIDTGISSIGTSNGGTSSSSTPAILFK